jgi:hypothetical protein
MVSRDGAENLTRDGADNPGTADGCSIEIW